MSIDSLVAPWHSHKVLIININLLINCWFFSGVKLQGATI